VQAGDDLAALIVDALSGAHLALANGDVIAVAQKIVSKAEGRLIRLADIEPGRRAKELARQADKDPRLVELILAESREVLRYRPGVIIVEHRLGIVLANAGIDRSNVDGGDDTVLLLPLDPDSSAADLRGRLESQLGVSLAVMVTDSIGRAWRLGTTGTVIGCAGIDALTDLRGRPDLFGRELQVSEIATADSAAAGAALVMGEGAESAPVVLIRGLNAGESAQTARQALRPKADDLFR